MTPVETVIEVGKVSIRATSSAILAIAGKQLQERRRQRKKEENAVGFSRKMNSWSWRLTRGRMSVFEMGNFAIMTAPGTEFEETVLALFSTERSHSNRKRACV